MLAPGQTAAEFMLEALTLRRRNVTLEKLGRWTSPSSWRWSREEHLGETILEAGPLTVTIGPRS